MTNPYDLSGNTYDGIGATTDGNTWIHATRALLAGGTQTPRNALSGAYTAGSGVLSFTDPLGAIVPGVRLSVGTNTFYVRSVNNTGPTATVFGGQEGSVDGSIDADTMVLVAPRWTDHEIMLALNAELLDLSGPGNGLFQIKVVDLTYSDSLIGYDLSGVTDLLDVYEVRLQNRGTFADWPMVPKHSWRLDRNAYAGVFASGLALQLFQAGYSGLKVRVLYRAGFTLLTSTVDDVTTLGLPSTALDIPPLGAAVRLVAPREIKRAQTESQPDPRRATEVPPGAVAGSMRGIAALRQQRISSEAERLMARYPDRMH